MVDRLRVSGGPVVTEDDATGEVTGDYDAINTERVNIGEWASYARYVIFATMESGTPMYHALDGASGEVVRSDTDAGVVVQHANDNSNQSLHIHFQDSYSNAAIGSYQFDTSVTFDKASLRVTGPGKNKGQLKLADGANTDIFVFDPGSGPIYEIQNIKFIGNKANNTSGSGIVNKTANEMNCFNVEFRSFPDHGFRFEPTVQCDYNYFDHCWFLDNDTSGLHIANSSSAVTELILDGCVLVGDSVTSPDPGKPALKVEAGADPKHISINGGTLKGGDVLLFEDGWNISLNGVQSQELMQNYAARFGSVNEVVDVVVNGCNFASNSVTNYLDFQSVNYANVNGGTMRGSSGDAVSWTTDTDNLTIENVNGCKTKAFGDNNIVGDGSTTGFTLASHGLDIDPDASDVISTVHVTPRNPNARDAPDYSVAATSTSIGINFASAPSSVTMSFKWSIEAKPA